MAAEACTSCGRALPDDREPCPDCIVPKRDETDRARQFLLPAYSIGCLTVIALLTVLLLVRIFL
jgi:predicted nucleic acid-binding Zn ribbon protein